MKLKKIHGGFSFKWSAQKKQKPAYVKPAKPKPIKKGTYSTTKKGQYLLDRQNPALGFIFNVTFSKPLKGSNFDYEGSVPFQEVSNLSKSSKSILIANGGDNTREYKLPTAAKHADLKIGRGMLTSNSKILDWFESLGRNPNTGRIDTADVIIELMSRDGENYIDPVQTWQLSDCYPTSFALGEFNSQKSEVVIETITLAYSKWEH